MKECGGVWLPDEEKHLVEWMKQRNELVDGKLTYQYHKLKAALRYVDSWDVAIDVGAHCGLWSMHLAKRFKRLLAFEPIAEHRECFKRNVPDVNGVLYACALGDAAGWVKMATGEASTGDTHIVERLNGERPPDAVELRRLDELVPFGTPVGFIKIDVEGYEEQVVQGGEELIQLQLPVICVEQKPHVLRRNFGHSEPKAVRLLESWGYRVREEISGDYILTV